MAEKPPLDLTDRDSNRIVAQYDRIMLIPKGKERDERLLEFIEFWGDALMNNHRPIRAPRVPGAN